MEAEEKKDLYMDLIKFRKALKQPKKDTQNTFFNSKYVTLEGVQRAIDEAIQETGLSYFQQIRNTDNGVSVNTIIVHESGQALQSGWLALNPVKQDPQGYGSAITYARRYQLSAMFGISSDLDDDGNASSQPQQPQRQQPRQAQRRYDYDNGGYNRGGYR